ncbi:hypothetical protein Ahy_A09g045637 [Arachis hypogaea]|uniref:Uncharacterized protein n=1 Tax=Arachis hypogaea TaxID=3818 RepID=A0A445BMS6_ARAHY|nr:hypothetical protein Ahy_A09g045637 [Arachis hypogaea]
MSWTTHILNPCDWYIHLLCTSPTKSIHFHVFDNITSNPDTSTTSSRPSSTTTPRARLSPLSDKQYKLYRVLHSFFSRVQVGRQLRPRIQAISTTSNVAIATHMETEAITEHWFGEEAEGSDRSGGQCGHGDDRAEEEGVTTTMTGFNKSDLLSRFMGSVEDDN